MTSLKFAALAGYCETRRYPMPIPEHKFHPVRKWRFDAAFLAEKIAVEFHGSVFARGRHTRGKGFTDDQEKWANAAILGWRIIPVTTEQFDKGTLWVYLDRLFGKVID